MQQRATRRPIWSWFGIEQAVIVIGFFIGGAVLGLTESRAAGGLVWLCVFLWAWHLFVNGIHWRPARIASGVFKSKPHIVEHAERLARSVTTITSRTVGEEISGIQLKQAPLDSRIFSLSGVRKLPSSIHVGRGFGVWHLSEFVDDSFAVPIPESRYLSLLQRVTTRLNESFGSDTQIYRCKGRLKGEEAVLVEQAISRSETVWCVIRFGADRGGQVTHIQAMSCIPRRWTWLDLCGLVPVVLFLSSIVFLPVGIVAVVVFGIVKSVFSNSDKILSAGMAID